jgi:hypothetical protein
MTSYALPTTGFYEGETTPSTVAEVAAATWAAQTEKRNFGAIPDVKDELYEKRNAAIFEATGVKPFHPMREQPTDDDYRELEEEFGTFSRNRQMAAEIAERRWHRELDRLAEQYPDKAAAIGASRTVWSEAAERVSKAALAEQRAVDASPLTVAGLNPVNLAVSFAGYLTDPSQLAVELAAMVLGPGGSAARGILWNASRQALVGAAVQTALEPGIKREHDKLGLQYGWDEALFNVLLAGGLSGGIDAGGRAIYRGVRGRPLSGTPESAPAQTPVSGAPEGAAPASIADTESVAISSPANDLDAVPARNPGGSESPPIPRDLDAALEAGARRLPEGHPVRLAAEGDAAASIELVERMGISAEDAAVRAALDQTKFELLQETSVKGFLDEANAADAQRRILLDSLARETAMEDAIAHAADPETNPPPVVVARDVPAQQPGEGFDLDTTWLHGSRAQFSRFDVNRGFIWLTQNREAASAFGQPMEFVARPGKVGSLRDFMGARQRAAQAHEPGTPEFNLAVVDELKRQGIGAIRDPQFKGAGGVGEEVMMIVDPDDVRPASEMRQLAALRDGALDPVSAAELIRERPELAAEVPVTTEAARGIHALARLDDAAFAEVRAGAVSPEIAAVVAAAPPGTHADVLARVIEARPRDTAEARRIVAEAMQRSTDVETAGRLLGTPDAQETAVRLASPEFDEPVGKGADTQTQALRGLEERAMEAVTGDGTPETWMRELVDAIAAADADADAGTLVSVCKLF